MFVVALWRESTARHSALRTRGISSRVKAHRAAAGGLAAVGPPPSSLGCPAAPTAASTPSTMTLPPITPHTTTVQQGMPTFATHFRERVGGVHRKRNKLARRHLGAARLGIAKEHARDVKLRLRADRDEVLRRRRAELKDIERRRKKIDVQRKEMEERTRHMRLMRHKVETADLTTRWHGVGGAEVPRRDLRTMRRARRVPEHNAFSTVLERDRMAEAALAEKSAGVCMNRRLFSIQQSEEPVMRTETAYRDHRHLVDENQSRARVHVKAPCPRFPEKKVLDTNDEIAVTLETEKWLAVHKNRDKIIAKLERRDLKSRCKARDDMDRFWDSTSERLAKLPPPVKIIPKGSAWQRRPQNRLPEWSIDTTVFLGAQPPVTSL